MEEEPNLSTPRSFGEIELEMNEKGFYFSGIESLTKFAFESETALFKTVPLQTKEDIIKVTKENYLKEQDVEVEVELVDQEGLSQNQKAVYVFVKPLNQNE